MKYDHWLILWCALSLGMAAFNMAAEPRTVRHRIGVGVYIATSAIMFLLIFRRMGLGYAQ